MLFSSKKALLLNLLIGYLIQNYYLPKERNEIIVRTFSNLDLKFNYVSRIGNFNHFLLWCLLVGLTHNNNSTKLLNKDKWQLFKKRTRHFWTFLVPHTRDKFPTSVQTSQCSAQQMCKTGFFVNSYVSFLTGSSDFLPALEKKSVETQKICLSVVKVSTSGKFLRLVYISIFEQPN
jgi:hypothetical protein